jgi:GNAT superfamily N-acetyltransferase
MRFIDAEWRSGHVLSRDEQLLRWQFDCSRVPGWHVAGPTVMLAWLGDAIVGMFGLTGCEMTLEGTAGSAVWLSHWFASPRYRGLNVAYGLLRAVLDLGLDVVATNGANPTATKLLRGLQFETVGALPRWIGVVNVSSAARLLADCNDGLALNAAECICERYRAEIGLAGSAASGSTVEVSPWRDELATAWDHCWKGQVAGRLVGTAREARFVRWRYLHHPRLRYVIRLATRRGDGSVIGLAAFRVEQVRGRTEAVMRVVEFLGTPAAQTALARAILQTAGELGVAYVDFYCSSATAARGLEAVGFKQESMTEDQPAFPTRLQPLEKGHFGMTALMRLPPAMRGQLNALVRAGRLYLTKSDGDQDRPN